jgi:hypothetical protein
MPERRNVKPSNWSAMAGGKQSSRAATLVSLLHPECELNFTENRNGTARAVSTYG